MIATVPVVQTAAAIQRVGIEGAITTTTGWTFDVGILVSSLAAIAASAFSYFLLRAYLRNNALQDKLAQLTSSQHEWLVRQDEPHLQVTAAYVTKEINSQGLRLYPGHLGAADPHTGFRIGLHLHNPGSAVIHVLQIQVALGDAFLGHATRAFRPLTREERPDRYQELLPRDLKELWLFIDAAAEEPGQFPNAEVTIVYISGSATRTLEVTCEAPEIGRVGTPISMQFTQVTTG